MNVKRLALFLTAAGVVLALAGCGGQTQQSSGTNNTGEEIIITGISVTSDTLKNEESALPPKSTSEQTTHQETTSGQDNPGTSKHTEVNTTQPQDILGNSDIDADIDELLRTLTEMEKLLDSLDNVTDDDLIVP